MLPGLPGIGAAGAETTAGSADMGDDAQLGDAQLAGLVERLAALLLDGEGKDGADAAGFEDGAKREGLLALLLAGEDDDYAEIWGKKEPVGN